MSSERTIGDRRPSSLNPENNALAHEHTLATLVMSNANTYQVMTN